MSLKRPYIVGISVPGYLHLKTAQPCQDACAYEVDDNRFCIIAVADGLGSASLSHIGSQLAVQRAVLTASHLIASDPSALSSIPLRMIESAREALIEKANEDALNLSDLATTLIVAVFDRQNLYCAQIGDGAIVIRSQGELKLLSFPTNSEYANEVIPITTEEYTDYLTINQFSGHIDCVSVFTDGCQRASLKKTIDGYEPFEGFFNPVFSFALGISDVTEAMAELEEFLLSAKISEHSEDDKTLVLAVL